MTFAAVVQRAADLGFSLLVLTDHIHIASVTDYAAHLDRLRLYRELRDDLPPGCRVVLGGEFEVAEPGRIIAPQELSDECECAIVAPNHFQLHWVHDPPADLHGAAAHELDCIQTILDWPRAEVVAHPFFGGATGHSSDALYGACDPGRLDEIMACALERGVAFEIQPKFTLNPTADRLTGFFENWLDRGGKVALGSDAHALVSLGGWQEHYAAIIHQFRLQPEALWWPQEERS
jgi:histidinol phosphatase-like PHP family hydrolase